MVRLGSSCLSSRSALWSSLVLFVILVGFWGTWSRREPPKRFHGHRYGHHHGLYAKGSVLVDPPVPCAGVRGISLDVSEDDAVREIVLDEAGLPQPYAGSYSDLGLQRTFIDRHGRYGPYGLSPESRGSPDGIVFWNKVDWAFLQNRCLEQNLRADLPAESVELITPWRRMTWPTWADGGHWVGSVPSYSRRKRTTGRTAIVLRSYSEYKYKDEDIWNLRALVTETALQYSGRYSVFILVDVHDENLDVMSNSKDYDEMLDRMPREFRNMTVLFDQRNFLKKWYSRILEWRPDYQMEQPRQLFAHFFPEFDHYWQLEMDHRFTGNAGRFLNAIEEFARNEPRKQSRERSSYHFTPRTYNTYANFTTHVNAALNGGSAFWTGARLPDLKPIGPPPPVPRPEEDDFEWGVGEEADLILLSSTVNITLKKELGKFDDWIFNFELKQATPRLSTGSSMNRCSWNLLNAMHEAQIWEGKRLNSAATPASFALWHGLKISRPPVPVYGYFDEGFTAQEIDIRLNGGLPSPDHDGMAWGVAYGNQFKQNTPITDLGGLWSRTDRVPTHLYRVWLDGNTENVEVADKDNILPIVRDGKILLPNTIMHSVKTNFIPPKNPKIDTR